MGLVKPTFLPAHPEKLAESGTLTLRDGTTAEISLARPDDHNALLAFIDRLPPESRRHRVFAERTPPTDLVAFLCDLSDPTTHLTLIVTRVWKGEKRIIASGSYFAKDKSSAEVALAVDDSFRGKGLGTLLLERMALLAIRHGFSRLWVTTHATNRALREVLKESGFELRETVEGGDVEVELLAFPTPDSVLRSEVRDRVATAASLRPFFQPNAVAVVGASRDPAAIGHRIVEALLANRFQGPVYPINPKATEVACIPAYPSAKDLPEAVDLAIIAVPREIVLHAVDECAERGVRALVVITAGFAEIGGDGRELQDRLVERVRSYGMRMVGPNCMGLLNTNPHVRLNASFAPAAPPAGRVAMLSQSGALGLAILRAAQRLNLGLSTFVSVGNKADVSGNDLLQYWEEDSDTDVILLYLESFGNPRRFAPLARRVGRRKPIVAVKGGRTQAGSRAAGSHTAALAGSEAGAEALFRQTGVIRADTLDEMFALASALGTQPLPRGRRVAIVSNAGGPAILCADACEAGGLTVSELSPEIKTQLAAFLPATASRSNPVDLIASASPEDYRRAIQILLPTQEIDALIIIYIPVDTAYAQPILQGIKEGITNGRAKGAADKPILLCWMAEEPLGGALQVAGEHIPIYASPETPAQALSKISTYAEWRTQPLSTIPDFEDMDLSLIKGVCTKAIQARGEGWLSAEETRMVLRASGLAIPAGGLARTADEAATIAGAVGFPVAVKLASRSIVHKTEIGGVRLNVIDQAAVRRAYGDIRDRLEKESRLEAMDGVLVQPMMSGGVEVMVGVTHDPLFGALVAFGLGGIHVEILRDVCFRVAPLTARDAAEMVREIRGYRLLEGYRGHPAADVSAIENVLLRISRLVEEIHEIAELDLNPIFAFPPGRGCRIVDARILVTPTTRPDASQ